MDDELKIKAMGCDVILSKLGPSQLTYLYIEIYAPKIVAALPKSSRYEKMAAYNSINLDAIEVFSISGFNATVSACERSNIIRLAHEAVSSDLQNVAFGDEDDFASIPEWLLTDGIIRKWLLKHPKDILTYLLENMPYRLNDLWEQIEEDLTDIGYDSPESIIRLIPAHLISKDLIKTILYYNQSECDYNSETIIASIQSKELRTELNGIYHATGELNLDTSAEASLFYEPSTNANDDALKSSSSSPSSSTN